MGRPNVEAIYPLSPMQQGMLFHSLVTPETGVYMEQTTCTLRGPLDVPAFERAWQRVVERHDILRTAFIWKRVEKLLQAVHRQVTVRIEQYDWRGRPAAQQEAEMRALLRTDRERGFDLSRPPLMRLALVRVADETYRFLWSHHHILLDGWSLPLLLKEVLSLYGAFRQGRDLYLPPARHYRDYINWLKQQDTSGDESFWRQVLRGFPAATPLVVDHATPVAADQPRYCERSRRLPLAETQALQAMARQHGLTLNTLVQGAWAVLLSRYTGTVEPVDGQDIVFGVTVSGRPADLAGAEEMVGLFINTLPLRVEVRPDAPLVSWLQALQARQAELQQYERSPLAEIQRWSDVPAGQPLFESILVFENYPVEASLLRQSQDLQIEDIRSFEQTNYSLTVVGGVDSELVLKMSYDASRFSQGAIERLLGHWSTLLLGMLGDSAAAAPQTLGALPMLTPAEKRQLLITWNETPRRAQDQSPAPCCAGHNVVAWFEEQARRAPQAIAVTSLGARPGTRRDLTYGELNERAEGLARYLRSRGVGPEVTVGLCMERSWEVLVGVLGILKAGGAYVPLDPNYPAERLAFMVEDSALVILLTQERLLERIPANASGRVVCLDADWDEIARAAGAVTGATANEIGPETLAYVIYTSGSTGKPKGALLVHRGLSNLIRYMVPLMELDASAAMLQFASLSFDASIVDLFTPLAAGGRLVMAPQGMLASVPDLLELLRRERITAVTLPPALLRILPHEGLPALRCVISAGEACSPEVAARWAQNRLFFNGYGPTETTVAATYYRVRDVPAGMTNIPIGQHVDHVWLYVVDSNLQPVPVGVPGELCIGGVSVGRGYLNRPELTASKFVPDPFARQQTDGLSAKDTGPRMYRSGDLVRYREDGNLEFLGRIDHQVKIRGYRIEPGEIEAFLEQQQGVQQAVVIVREEMPGDKRLVAYVLPKQEPADGAPRAPVTVPQLRESVRQGLPAYMAPAAYVVLDRLPLTPSGKVDRKALASMEGYGPGTGPGEAGDRAGQPAYVAPRTPVEGVLVGIFEQVLGVEHVGIRDHFFELGGHSLLATQAASRVRNVLDVDLPLQDLFEAPTVEALAERVERLLGTGAEKAPAIVPAPRSPDQPLPLSFSQERLWFLDQLAPGNLYNIPIAAKLSGALHQGALEASLREIVRRHEILRTTFRAARGAPVQESAPYLDVPWAVTDLTGLPRPQREAEARRLVRQQAEQPFDLAQGPLLRAHLLKLGKEEHVILMVFHHIVFDGWSADVFLSELAALYGAFAAPAEHAVALPLAPLDIQYADYAVWQRSWLQGEVLQRQMAYWERVLSPLPPTLDLPTDHPRPAVQSWRGGAEDFQFSPELLLKLTNLGRAEGATLFMTLLAAFQVLLYRYTDQEDLSIGSPIANRHHPGVDKLIGFFVNTLVLRTDLSGAPTFRQLLQRVRKAALEAYSHQDVPFEMLVEKLHPQRDLSHNPLFQVAFTVQEQSSVGMLQAGLGGLKMMPWPIDEGTAKFDLTLILSEGAEGLSGTFEYNRDLFEPATIRRMIGHLRTLLEDIATDVAQPIAALPLLTPAEKQEMLVEWNRTKLATPADHCAHQLFEAQAALQPEAIAVTFEDQALTYGELNRRANQLAHYLRELGVGASADRSPRPDMLVGILTERSLEMVVGILGTMKAGGAYLPLDPAYPPDRLAFMLQDARVPVLLTQARLAEQIQGLVGYDSAAASLDLRGIGSAGLQPRAPSNVSELGAVPRMHIVRLDEDWSLIARKSVQPPAATATPDNLAYVIYTSGSTGRPKGTMLAHRGLSNLAEVQRQAFDVRSGCRVLQFSSLSFDASVWETFMALSNGATLCLARQEVLASGVDLARLLREHKITHATLPPSVLRVLPPDKQAQERGEIEFPNLQVLVAAGEACTTDLVARWAPGRRFFNAYGPTETTVCASMHLCDPARLESPPIGRPIGNFKFYVLDARKQPVPVGVPGELYIGGIGLALGYLRRPELTAERMVPDPFSKRAGARLYRTGDLVRYRPDGEVEFLGRIDQQVKIRGFRIELGEIESVLREHPGVVECAVAPKEMGGSPAGQAGPEISRPQRLVAYVVLAAGQNNQDQPAPDADALRVLLRQRLPEYMVPSAFVALEALPLMPNGKVDRRALPDPQQVAPGAGFGNGSGERVAPRTPTEQALAALWRELLGVEQVGAEDNFFDLGGHSLLATQLVSRVQETIHVELPVRALFEAPTLSQLAQQIDALQQSSSQKLDAVLQALQQVQTLSEQDVVWMLRDGAPGSDEPGAPRTGPSAAPGRPRTEPAAAS